MIRLENNKYYRVLSGQYKNAKVSILIDNDNSEEVTLAGVDFNHPLFWNELRSNLGNLTSIKDVAEGENDI